MACGVCLSYEIAINSVLTEPGLRFSYHNCMKSGCVSKKECALLKSTQKPVDQRQRDIACGKCWTIPYQIKLCLALPCLATL